jgi:sirohydrochlorin cobaltochelatase
MARPEPRPDVAELEHRLRAGEVRLGEVTVTRREGRIHLQGPGPAARPAPAAMAEFRAFIRQDEQGRYRPLSGARTLRHGWRLACASVEDAVQYLDAVYPLALRHAAQERAGTLRVVTAAETLGRQSGNYAAAGSLTPSQCRRAVHALCGLCVRRPRWAESAAPGEGAADIPCPEPCGVFVAFAATVEGGALDDTAPPDGVGWADFSAPDNPVMARYRAE